MSTNYNTKARLAGEKQANGELFYDELKIKIVLYKETRRAMMKIRIGNELLTEHVRVRIRVDYRGESRSGRFFFGGKSKEQMAESMREQQVALLRNVPLQGIFIEDVDLSLDVYSVNEGDGRRTREVAYAPIILTLRIENLDDLLPLLIKPEFRKIEFLSPENISLHRLDMERLLFRISQAFQQEIKQLEQKYAR